MHIASISFHLADLGRPYRISGETGKGVKNAIAVITLENGIRGIGTANPSKQVVGEDVLQTLELLNGWDQEQLLGKDIRGFHRCLDVVHTTLDGHTGARAALDIALHDAFTRWLDIPLAVFLGQRITSLPTSVTIGIKNVAETLGEAEEYIGRGFRFIKIKLGKTLAEDIERLARLREAFGTKIHLRVDANQAYTSNELLHFYDKTKNLSLELIEQPLPVSETGKLKQLPLNIRKLVAADESLVTAKDAIQLSSYPGSCGIFNIKLMKCGGIRPAIDIAAIAGTTGVDLMWGCNDESRIGISAALHTALSHANTRYLDLDGSLDLARDVAEGAFGLTDGMMTITGHPGLGWTQLLL